MNGQDGAVELEYPTVQEIVTERLRNAILRGELKPGEKLVQDELGRRYGVSRMPIREACRILEGEGLVTFHRRRGVVVKELSGDEIREIFSIRALLEGMAAELAATHMTGEVVSELHDILAHMEAALDDPDRYLDLNQVFHDTLFGASQRRRLVSLINRMRHTVEPYLRLHLSAEGRMPDSLAEHRAIYQACASGDGEEATRQAENHIRSALRALLASLPKRSENA